MFGQKGIYSSMKARFISIPFKIDGQNSGISTVEGIGKFSPAGIVLEFETKILGLVKTGVKELQIPRAEILDIRLKSGVFDSKVEKMFGAKIEIRLNNFAKLSELPNKAGKIILKIQRQDRELAENALKNLQIDANENQEFLPQTNTPIGELFKESETEELK